MGILIGVRPAPEWKWLYLRGDCAGHGQFIYQRLYADSRPIDWAFIGSSRTIHGPIDSLLEQLTVTATGGTTHVATLGYCRFGRDMTYQLFRELLTQKAPKAVVLEVHEGESRYGHPIYPYVADGTELIWPVGGPTVDYGQRIQTALQTRWAYWRDQWWHTAPTFVPSDRNYGYGPSSQVADSLAMYDRQQRLSRRYTAGYDTHLRQLRTRYSRRYLHEIHRLATEQDIGLYFLYLPAYGTQVARPYDADLYEELGTLLLPPDTLFTDWRNWLDGDHLNDRGATRLTQWLAKRSEVSLLKK